ncbi:GFA family protein [Azospira restricta]|uniref:Aldehyde-activating protein n=1 Tax=Azospira restricta TaxID=404405 RepID=A0A974SNP0_9RHOO|nr:aldehyde-activating protein [Azospira restricta]QRJ63627.1 aldehyde-activating protein [Azospira restricta]
MDGYHLRGGCHCGALRIDIGLPRPPETYGPRACDCDFCRKHGAAYFSDPDGSLRVMVGDARFLGRYRQGSGIAECLLCTNCGVLLGVAYREDERLYAAINYRVVEGGVVFGEAQPVSPKTLTANEKVRRWKALWFADVALVGDSA